MSSPVSRRLHLVLLALAFALSACATSPHDPTAIARDAAVAARSGLAAPPDRTLEDQILALDPEHVSDRDVRETLARGPTPHVMLIHGGIYPVHLVMESFAEFLVAMGYPVERIRDPGEGTLSRSPYESSDNQVGVIAWHYEREGVRPMLIGHSQGGIQVVKLLHTLAGEFDRELRVLDPLTGAFETRTSIVDPFTGQPRPVVGLSVAYASVIGTGGWSLALPFHWQVFTVVRTIPDTVGSFTGYRIALDLFAWDVPGLEGLKTFHASGKAEVRNVTLPASYSHVFAPGTAHLAEDPEMREWINAFDPAKEASWRGTDAEKADNALWAADVWHSIKRHWALEAQQFVQARRGGKP
jgi:hypothetical protein